MKKIIALLLTLLVFAGCGKKEKIDDTVKWINGTYAVFTVINNGDINEIGGFKKTPETVQSVKDMLKEWWGITNREEADNAVEWLMNEGHRKDFLQSYYANELQNLSREELNENLEKLSKEDKVYYTLLFNAYEKYGEDAVTGWDYSRAVQLLGYYYLADYYTYEETMDKSLAVSRQIQKTFSSWDDFVQSYLYGYQYWNDDDIEQKGSSSYNRAETYKKIKAMSNSPYKLDWKMELKKSW